MRGEGAEDFEMLVNLFAKEQFFDACSSTDKVRATVWDKTSVTVKRS